ncbi:MAG: rhomboid family intramembrane serine protease [Mariprofundus sp.]|nr:rhomboid family intramembrane serine protease [Mariprofundus sp.]
MIAVLFSLVAWGVWFMSPQHAALLVYDRDAIAAGEWYRLWTAHLVHARYIDLIVNSAMLALFGLLSIGSTRFWQVALCFAVAMPMMTGILFVVSPHTTVYQGSFAIAAMMVMMTCSLLMLENRRFSLGFFLGLFFLLLFLTKLGLEGSVLFHLLHLPALVPEVVWMMELCGSLVGLAFSHGLHQSRLLKLEHKGQAQEKGASAAALGRAGVVARRKNA